MDPIGTQGAGAPADDLTLIYRGGENFLKRMQALAGLRDAHEAAFAKLQLGQDAQTAFDDAKKRLAEASSIRDDAGALRDRAAKEAAALLAKAQADAVEIKRNAADDAKAAAEKATALRLEAENYAAKVRLEADARQKSAAVAERVATAKQAEAEAALKRHQEAHQTAFAAQREAEQRKADLDAKIAKLSAAIRETA